MRHIWLINMLHTLRNVRSQFILFCMIHGELKIKGIKAFLMLIGLEKIQAMLMAEWECGPSASYPKEDMMQMNNLGML